MTQYLRLPSGRALAEPHVKRGHTYGDMYLAARYCGFEEPPLASVPFEWQHGWAPSFLELSPEAIVGTDGLSYLRRGSHLQLVATTKQAVLLQSSGYKKAEAIGLPFTYVKPQGFKREIDTVLYVFTHSTYQDYNRRDEPYHQIDRIFQLSGGEKTYMMLHGANLTQDCADYAEGKGVKIILGADNGDIESLRRVRQIFESFEVVVTDSLGSHVIYAMISGAKVEFVNSSKTNKAFDELPDRKYFRNSPYALSDFAQYKRLQSHSEVLNRTLSESKITDSNSAWLEAGGLNKPSPEDLSLLLGWRKTRRFSAGVKLKSSIKGNFWLVRLYFEKVVNFALRWSPNRLTK